MRRWIALGAVFFLSLCVFLVALMPAAVVVDRLPALRPGGAPLVLSQPRGRWWDATVNARWRDQQGTLAWTLDWHGLTPGLQLSLRSDDLQGDGWLGADWGDWRLEQWRATVPVAMISRQVPQGNADGTAHVSLMVLELAGGSVVDAKGTLDYSGGTVTWSSGSARVPPLDGRLFMGEQGPRLRVTGPDQQQLVEASIEKKMLKVQVHRAWPQLLGVSQGGDPSDVVFQMSQPLKFGS
ncbi:type II secretion system protein N [Alloalcanivorax mobilis]|uniref:type II secretion system protein N n=1 Tax=Alloalcanivorax mobilis TaxID=2019569 RepID=UPI000B5B15B8|nr:type II secretion system protein N [Alloalcanivorax mobilis]ASK35108.1 type II secretion system protein N [Alcanivorax sp. N3-2A]|tara:strand:- start:25863 stop:26576 length:714 start_codon:yes stop_codon:yes gene_type:complete